MAGSLTFLLEKRGRSSSSWAPKPFTPRGSTSAVKSGSAGDRARGFPRTPAGMVLPMPSGAGVWPLAVRTAPLSPRQRPRHRGHGGPDQADEWSSASNSAIAPPSSPCPRRRGAAAAPVQPARYPSVAGGQTIGAIEGVDRPAESNRATERGWLTADRPGYGSRSDPANNARPTAQTCAIERKQRHPSLPVLTFLRGAARRSRASSAPATVKRQNRVAPAPPTAQQRG